MPRPPAFALASLLTALCTCAPTPPQAVPPAPSPVVNPEIAALPCDSIRVRSAADSLGLVFPQPQLEVMRPPQPGNLTRGIYDIRLMVDTSGRVNRVIFDRAPPMDAAMQKQLEASLKTYAFTPARIGRCSLARPYRIRLTN